MRPRLSPSAFPQSMSILAVSLRVMFRTEKMQRHIRLIAYDPTVVARADVKQISGSHFVIPPVLHLAGGTTGPNHADLLHIAEWRAGRGSHVRRPFPSRFVTRAPNRHRSDLHYFEFSFFKSAHLIRLLEALDQEIIVVW